MSILQSSKQYPQCIEAYKESLRNNPKDDETRYNLALAQKLLKDQQQDQQNQDQQEQQQKQQKKEEEKPVTPPAPPAPSKEEVLLTEIRDLLKEKK